PPGSIVQYREPTVWQQHRNELLAVMGAFGLQTVIVIILLIQTQKRRQAESSPRESEQRMAFAAAATDTGIWELDIAAGRLWTTEHSRSMLGLDSNTPPTMAALSNRVHPDDRPTLNDAIRSAIRLGRPISEEFRVVRADGGTRWLAAGGQPRFDDD